MAKREECQRCAFHGHPCLEHRADAAIELVREEHEDLLRLRREALKAAGLLRKCGEDAAAKRLERAAGGAR